MSSNLSEEIKKIKGNWKVTVDENMPDYSQDPFFLKKKAMAIETLSKTIHNFPIELLPPSYKKYISNKSK